MVRLGSEPWAQGQRSGPAVPREPGRQLKAKKGRGGGRGSSQHWGANCREVAGAWAWAVTDNWAGKRGRAPKALGGLTEDPTGRQAVASEPGV